MLKWPTKRDLTQVLAKASKSPSAIDAEEGTEVQDVSRLQFLKQYSVLGIIGLLLAGVYIIEYVYTEGANLRNYSSQIESVLQQHELEISNLAADTAFLQRQVFGMNKLSPEDQIEDTKLFSDLSRRPFNTCLYDGDSIIFWTNNRVFLPGTTLHSRIPDIQLRQMKNGYYVVKNQRIELFKNRIYNLVSLIPIKNDYRLHSEYLKNTFIANEHIPEAISLSQVPTAFPIRSSSGETVGYLHGKKAFQDRNYQILSICLHLFAFLLLANWLNKLAVRTETKFGPWAGGGVVLFSATIIRQLLNSTDWASNFEDLGFISQVFKTPVLSGSLGGLIANVLIILWLTTFFHKHYHLADYSKSQLKSWGITTAHYSTITLGAFGLAHAFQKVIEDSSLVFDFKNVLNLDFLSVIAVLAMLLLMFSLFLFSHRLMLGIEEIGFNKKSRFIALLAGMAAITPIIFLVGSPLPIPHFLIGTLIFVLVFDMFIDSGESNVLWLFFWLVLIAMYSAALLFTFNEKKDLQRRVQYAKVLCAPRDSIAEVELIQFINALRSDIHFQEALALNTKTLNLSDITPLFEKQLINQSYLYNNYTYRVWGYNAANDSTFFQGRFAIDAKNAIARYNRSIKIDQHISYQRIEDKPLEYIINIQSDLQRSPTRNLILELRHESRSPSRVFTELMIDDQYRQLSALPEYDYAIYHDGKRIEEEGGNHPPELRLQNLPQPGNFISATTSQHSSVLYAGDEGTVVLIGKDMGGYWRPMSLFSYLFVWCILLTILMSILNSYIDFMPTAIDLTWLGKPDLKTKIQVGIVALVLLSFSMIGYVTVVYFRNSTDVYHDNRLNRKVASIIRNTEHEIQLLNELTVIDATTLSRIINPISEIHQMDVNLYDRNGNLISSSETDIFKRGVIAPKMGSYAFQMLEKRGRSQVVQVEAVGNLEYRTAYVRIRMPEGETIAYMGLPYYSKQRDLRDDVSSFMGTLLNVYVFLLLIAGVIAISVANSITRPLSELGAKIRKFKIDKKNEPLEWSARDELGALISEFNTMLSTVEESAKELDNARREKAWREMAQQVAHEIKNPLTPMKLSIQYLKHAYDRNPDPEMIEPLIKRVSTTLIEQIDNLSSIASTFSTFARMPEPENSLFQLDELVETVYDLFREENVDSSLEIEKPAHYQIFADKKLLMRVLNNLIKNAIQAVPETRRGIISIKLEELSDIARISVTDNGAGIPEEMQEKVFFPKFTTKSSGTGLGLAICRDIVKAAKGKIYFKTQENVGSTFIVDLPLCSDDHIADTEQKEILTPPLTS